jgi:outer membrane protein
MRTRVVMVLAALALVALVATAGADEKIGYVNSEQIRLEYKGAKDIDGQLEASVADWRSKARDMEKEIDTLATELSNQRLLLSDEAARAKEQAIKDKRAAFESYLNDVWGTSGLAAKREAELWQPVFDKATAIIEKIGSDGGYVMILDAAQMGIVYAAPSTDLTQQVLDQLNSEAE